MFKKQLQAIQSANQKEKGSSPHQSNWTVPKSFIPSKRWRKTHLFIFVVVVVVGKVGVDHFATTGIKWKRKNEWLVFCKQV